MTKARVAATAAGLLASAGLAYYAYMRRKCQAKCPSDTITIVGAGLIGSLLAILLREKGYEVVLYERYGDIRKIPSVGRSINLSCTVRGLRALDILPRKVKADLLKLGSHVTGRIIHTNGESMFQRYGKDDTEYNHSISRYELNRFLLQRAEEAGATLRFGHQIVDIDLAAGNFPRLRFEVERGEGVAPEPLTVDCTGPVIAADGGGSGVRRALMRIGAVEATEEKLDSGYKEMLFPKGSAEKAGLARHGLHIWPRGTHFLMALVNLDGSFTGTIYMKNEKSDGGEQSFAAVEAGGVKAAERLLSEHYADALPALGGVQKAAKQLASNPRGLLGTVRVKQWAHGGKLCLVGDAAHAIVPFFGQGMNCGFEDCREMVTQLSEHAPAGAPESAKDFATAFANVEARRRPNSNAIADMALENYVEMMSHTADPTFRKAKAVENALENSPLGSRFRSRYAMVCYGGAGNVTYSAAQQLGRVQWEIVCELAKGVSSPELAAKELDLKVAEKLMDERLLPLQRELQVDLKTVSHHE